jgi:hypothetical protein
MFKQTYLATAFTIFSVVTASSQTISVGPIAGVNLMTISNSTNTKTLTGLSAGAFANFSIKEHYGVNLKLLFSQMGTGFKNSDAIVRLNYIQLPVSMVYFFGNTGNTIRPKIFGGLYASYLLQAQDNNGNDIVFPNGENVYFNSDFGAQFGAGLNYIIRSRIWLNFEAGYSTSFSSIADIDGSKNRNSGFQVNAGISFPLSE